LEYRMNYIRSVYEYFHTLCGFSWNSMQKLQ